MPAKAQWLLRLPDIRQQLGALSVPVVDRAVFESVFQVGRRRAHQLIQRFGGFQSGRTFLIDRASLLRSLESLEAGDVFRREAVRKQRLSAELDQVQKFAAAARVPIRVEPAVFESRLSSLPSGIRFEPGRLIVDYQTPQELLERLFALSQALLNDLNSITGTGLL